MARNSINPDHFLMTDGERVWSPERSAQAWRLAFEALEACLRTRSGDTCRVVVVCGLQGAGKSTWIERQPDDAATIYFDAALPGVRHRKPIIEIARSHGATAFAVWVRVALREAVLRNAGRPADEIVPEASIRSVAAGFEPPSTHEGFERVTIVDT